MGMVKAHIDDLTWNIMARLDIEDDDEGKNHDKIFQWVMNQDYIHKTDCELAILYKKEKHGKNYIKDNQVLS